MSIAPQYKSLCIISNNIEEPVQWTKEISRCSVIFETLEENEIIHESLYCQADDVNNHAINDKI